MMTAYGLLIEQQSSALAGRVPNVYAIYIVSDAARHLSGRNVPYAPRITRSSEEKYCTKHARFLLRAEPEQLLDLSTVRTWLPVLYEQGTSVQRGFLYVTHHKRRN